MDCIKCNSQIPEGRIQILPNTKTCVNCSSTSQWYARPVITGKTTYSEVEVIKDTNAIKELLIKRTKEVFPILISENLDKLFKVSIVSIKDEDLLQVKNERLMREFIQREKLE